MSILLLVYYNGANIVKLPEFNKRFCLNNMILQMEQKL